MQSSWETKRQEHSCQLLFEQQPTDCSTFPSSELGALMFPTSQISGSDISFTGRYQVQSKIIFQFCWCHCVVTNVEIGGTAAWLCILVVHHEWIQSTSTTTTIIFIEWSKKYERQKQTAKHKLSNGCSENFVCIGSDWRSYNAFCEWVPPASTKRSKHSHCSSMGKLTAKRTGIKVCYPLLISYNPSHYSSQGDVLHYTKTVIKNSPPASLKS